jgi:hypothetical protein
VATKASVKVQIVLEVEINAAWGDECTVGQVRAQGTAAAERTVRGALEGGSEERKRLRVVGIKCSDVTIREEP